MNKALEMPKHVVRYKESGLAVSAYCLQNGISYHSMQYWIKKISKPTKSQVVSANKDMFIELGSSKEKSCNLSPLSGQSDLSPQVEISFPSGLRLKIYS